jgi:hypothetical protein
VLLAALGGAFATADAGATLPAETTSCPPGKIGSWDHVDGHLPFRVWYETKGESPPEIRSLRHEAIELAGEMQHTIWPRRQR